jgi:hypothetical protein
MTPLTKYWTLEQQLVKDDDLSQDRYDDSDWEPVFKAVEAEAVLKETETVCLEAIASLKVYVYGGNPNSPYRGGINPFYVMGSKESLDHLYALLDRVKGIL